MHVLLDARIVRRDGLGEVLEDEHTVRHALIDHLHFFLQLTDLFAVLLHHLGIIPHVLVDHETDSVIICNQLVLVVRDLLSIIVLDAGPLIELLVGGPLHVRNVFAYSCKVRGKLLKSMIHHQGIFVDLSHNLLLESALAEAKGCVRLHLEILKRGFHDDHLLTDVAHVLLQFNGALLCWLEDVHDHLSNSHFKHVEVHGLALEAGERDGFLSNNHLLFENFHSSLFLFQSFENLLGR